MTYHWRMDFTARFHAISHWCSLSHNDGLNGGRQRLRPITSQLQITAHFRIIEQHASEDRTHKVVLQSIQSKMPLVKIFAKTAMSKPIPLAALQSKLCDIWGTKPNTTKLMLQRVDDWTDESFAEDVYGTYLFWIFISLLKLPHARWDLYSWLQFYSLKTINACSWYSC